MKTDFSSDLHPTSHYVTQHKHLASTTPIPYICAMGMISYILRL